MKSKTPVPEGFGTYMHYINTRAYNNKRIRISAYIKAENVEGWSGLWLRIDGPNGQMLGFDNMQDRAISGTLDWKEYEVVLDVGEEALGIGYGLILSGKGSVWMDCFKLEEVDESVKITGSAETPGSYPTEPVNLNFED